MRLVTLVLAALVCTGCVSADAKALINALAKDNASACVAVHATLYGDLTACRTNTQGRAIIRAGSGAVEIQHQGK